LTPAEKKLADYVLQYPSETVGLPAAALAQRAGTAPSAVVRFCKSLGFEGFPAFKVRLAVALSQQIPASYMSGAARGDSSSTVLDKIFAANIKALQDTVARIDRVAFSEAVALLAGANTIHIYGVGTSAGMVNELQHRLMILGFRSQGFTDIASMRLSTMNLQPGDVAIGISHSGRTLVTMETLELSRKAGAKTVCLTSYSASPITTVCDQVLTVYCDETHYPVEAASARIAQTGVIDALVAALSVQRYDISVQRSAQIHDLMETIRKKEKP
jgi:DNA-binding MurR/RpiR family transcriptional regulator